MDFDVNSEFSGVFYGLDFLEISEYLQNSLAT